MPSPNTTRQAPFGWPAKGVHSVLAPFDVERFEYAITENARKQESNPPPGDDWSELDWQRFELHGGLFYGGAPR